MNPHIIIFNAINRSLDCFKALQCRQTYCLLSVINYTNGLIIASWLFSSFGGALEAMYCASSCLFGIALAGLYMNRAMLMVPDVLYKVVLSLCALIYAIQEVDALGDVAVCRLLLVNYVLFQTLSTIHLEMQQLVQTRPPPNYDQLSELKICRASACDSSKVVMSEPVDEPARPETPPPSYELAVKTLKCSKAESH
ncbi:hypothetical protein Q1695_015605 [Nippostrongylus brasiliensis]|nr:hypothetical protein Q1695_015605 [Nippostrongylus brasiliensis]